MKKKTKKTVARPRRVAPTPSSTALARLRQEIAAVRLPAAPPQVLPAVVEQQALRTLDDSPQLGQLGLQPLTLSAEAEAILSEPVVEARVSIKPTGAVYLSHIEYTRWFNRAFGRAQWNSVPVTKPQLSPIPNREEQLATQTFLLFVHGKPVAQATGEQEYHPSNSDQSYADVLEALNASALRRLAKRLGIGLELWDRPWTEAWRERFAVKVWIEGKTKPQWRRKDAPPFYKEQGSRAEAPRSAPAGSAQHAPAHGRAADGRAREGAITEGQVKRLWAIFKKSGRVEADLKKWLVARYGIDSTSKIRKADYDFIITSIESSAELPLQAAPPLTADSIPWGQRDPGEEG